MSLPLTPPAASHRLLREGMAGFGPWALQLALGIAATGVFDERTTRAVKKYQRAHFLVQDGLVGPATMRALVVEAINSAEGKVRAPDGLLRGLVESESGYVLDAVNWAVLGGVDCGTAQQRVYGPPYGAEALRSAFHVSVAVLHSLTALRQTATAFARGEPGEREWRLAAMAHNWPTQGGADYIAVHGKCSSPDKPASWIPRDARGKSIVHFPDGAVVNTRWEWCMFYALGGPHGEGMTTKYVASWAA